MTRLTLSLLGMFRVERDGLPLAPIRSGRIQALLAYLVLEARRPHNRDALASVFWPDEPQTVARQNLRQAIYQLRRILNDGDGVLLLLTRETAQFNPLADYHLDVEEFQAAARAGRLADAAVLYHGELLPQLAFESDRFEEWLLLRREALHLLALGVFDELAEQALAAGDDQAAQQYARRQLVLEPWRESAHRQLMTALARCGDRTAALAQFETCRRVLMAELGVEPEHETLALVQRIENGLELAPRPGTHARRREYDWGEAPGMTEFYGREAELRRLREWLREPQCRLIGVVGMGGIGKTTLIARLLHDQAEPFEVMIWRSLVNAPALDDLLADWLSVLNGAQAGQLPASLPLRLNALFEHLRRRRCLLVLDNAESILQSGDRAGSYAAGYEQYGQLFARAGQSAHQSCLVLTSREVPRELARLASERSAVHILSLDGFDAAVGAELLAERGLRAAPVEAATLVDRYSGNPLALKLVADTISGLFGGDIRAFVGQQTLIFDDIRDVLDQQFTRLPDVERLLLRYLAIAREPLGEADVWALAEHSLARHAFVEALRSLMRRSLLEHAGGSFRLQNVVTEYVTDDVIGCIIQEIEHSRPDLLERLALLNTAARDYVVQSQQRMLLQPIGQRLIAAHGRAWLAARAAAILSESRSRQPLQPGFLAGNMLNLLLSNGVDVRGFDLSRLCVWQAYLRGADLPELNLTGADLRGSVFTDYVGAAMSVAISPDGAVIATGADNGLIYLWDAQQRQLIGICEGHAAQVWSVSFSPDGRLLASSSDDRSARIWDVGRRACLQVLTGHANGVACVAFSPDGAILATASTDQDVRIWNAGDGLLIRTLAGHSGMVISVAFSPDGRDLASASHDQTIRIWDWQAGTLKQVLSGHHGPVVAVAYGGSSRMVLASGSHDQTARLWDARTYAPLATLAGHNAPVLALAFSGDGAQLVTGSDDQTIRVWDLRALEHQSEVRTTQLLRGHYGAIFALATRLSHRQELLASVSPDKTTRIWDVQSGAALAVLRGHSKWLQSIVFAPDGRLLVGGSDGRQVVIWDGASGRTDRVLHGHASLTEKLSASADGARLISAGWDATARIWDVQAGHATHILYGHTAPVVAVALGHDVRGQALAVSGGLDCTIRVWNAESGQSLAIWHGHHERVAAFAFQPGGAFLASGSWDATIGVWDTRTGELARFLDTQAGPVESVAFSPDGRRLASAGWDAVVRIWDFEHGQCVHALEQHTNGLEMVAFSPDGRLLASCGCDHMVCVWDAATGQLLHQLRGHANWVRCVAFAPARDVLASGSDDGTLKLWDIRPGAGICYRTIRMDDPYTGMIIADTTGLAQVQKTTLMALGAVERPA